MKKKKKKWTSKCFQDNIRWHNKILYPSIFLFFLFSFKSILVMEKILYCCYLGIWACGLMAKKKLEGRTIIRYVMMVIWKIFFFLLNGFDYLYVCVYKIYKGWLWGKYYDVRKIFIVFFLFFNLRKQLEVFFWYI